MITAIDFETAPIEPGLMAPPPVCLSFANAEGSGLLVGEDMHAYLRTVLANGMVLVGCNVAYDLAVAVAEWQDLWPSVFEAYDHDRVADVGVRQRLIEIAMGEYRQHGGFSLDALVHRLCDREMSKDDAVRLTFWPLRDTPVEQWPEAHKTYAIGDAQGTLDVFLAQEKGLAEVHREAVLADQHRQCRAAFALHLVECWGLRTDAAGVAALRRACEERQSVLRDELLAAGLLRETKKGISRSVRVAQERMLQVCPNARLTEKGRELKSREVKYISVDEEACQDSGDPVLEHYSEFSRLGSLLSGHVTAMEAGTVLPIHTHFEVLLDTGRTSSSAPNVQNVRRLEGARECFVPREGWVFVGCDFDKAELHTLAQTCLDLFHRSALADALNGGYDPHTGLGARLAHDTYEGLKEKIAAGDPVAKEWRPRAKPGNFGFPGGMGPNGMQAYAKSTYGVIMTLAECEELYAGWQEQWPEVAYDYLGWIKDLTAATGFTTIEHFTSGRWRGRVPFCVAANSFFQGRTADGMKAALYAVIRKCYLPGTALYGCRVVNEVHDEFIVEAPLVIAPEAAEELRSTMIAAYNAFTPDVPVHASPVLMDRWSKKAKELRENGRLVLWRYAA
jgi:DNA polymerase I